MLLTIFKFSENIMKSIRNELQYNSHTMTSHHLLQTYSTNPSVKHKLLDGWKRGCKQVCNIPNKRVNFLNKASWQKWCVSTVEQWESDSGDTCSQRVSRNTLGATETPATCATETAERVNRLVYRRVVMDDLLIITCLKDAELENNVKTKKKRMHYLLNTLFIISPVCRMHNYRTTVDNIITVLYAVKINYIGVNSCWSSARKML